MTLLTAPVIDLPFSMLDPEFVARLIRETARSVILPRFGTLKHGDVHEKAPGDLVTIADLEAERLLGARLSAAIPGSAILGEEGVAADPSRLKLTGTCDNLWIIDPVDGTANFARGHKDFAVIVAYVERGRTCAGWILDPVGDRLVWARAGEGAWSDGRRLRLAPAPAELVGAAYGRAVAGMRSAKAVEQAGMRTRNRGSSGIEYVDLALGETQFALHSRALPWDHAAGMLITTEAGGRAAFLDGAPYDPHIHDRPLLAAVDAACWTRVRDAVTAPGTTAP
ncbi:MAG: inositol monophosphatase family protein [Alphaproteobacteria bacterium]|nr:inositol monophosphatase family protein [Alphaproteobacteria bacterium]